MGFGSLTWFLVAVLAAALPRASMGDRCGDAVVQLNMDEIQSNGAITQTGRV